MTQPRLPQPVRVPDPPQGGKSPWERLEALERTVRDLAMDLGRRQRVAQSDVIASLALQPPMEVRTIRMSGTFPIPVRTRVADVAAVLGGGAAKAGGPLGDGGDTVGTYVAWRVSDSDDDPGLYIDDVLGPVWQAGTEWDVTVVIVGREG